MGTLIIALFILINTVAGLALGFWHRDLMVRLYTNHPDIWQRLGREDIVGSFWPLSLRLPVWSWSSLFFLIGKRYLKLADNEFSRNAARFRMVWIAWLIELCFALAICMSLGLFT